MSLLALTPSHSGGAPGAPLQNLATSGYYFTLADGSPTTIVGCSDFNLLNRLDNEGAAAVLPVIKQRAGLRFNMHRVWTAYDIPLIGTYPLCDYSKIPLLNRMCADVGTRLELTGYTGINDPDHWYRLIEAALKCSPYPLLDYVNELSVNLDEPDQFGRMMGADINGTPFLHGGGIVGRYYHEKPPNQLLANHGSNGSQAQPVYPLWGWFGMHYNDAPQATRKTGHNTREVAYLAGLADETTRCGDRYTDPGFAYWSAAGGSLLCGGTFFHSVEGKLSVLFTGDQLTCAKAWTDGAWSVPLECHCNQYDHREDLEGPNAGQTGERAYQTCGDPNCIVHIPPYAG